MDDILPRIIENFYSRVPVYGVEEEGILGILFTKDLTRLKHLPREKVSLKSILHDLHFCSAVKKNQGNA